MPYSLTLSHVGIYIKDMNRMVDFSQPARFPVDISLPDKEFWASVEAKARTMPGFKPLAVWEAEIKERIASASAKRRSALVH